MKRPLFLAIAALVSTAAIPAHAELLDVRFSGTVATTTGATGYDVGAAVTGDFVYNTDTNNYLSFTVAGQSAPAGFASSAAITPSFTDAIYEAQISPVQQGGPINSSFALDLSSLTAWPTTDTATTLLFDTTQLATNLDTAANPLSAYPSTFSYYTALADGTQVVALTADLTSLTVAAPEPASLLLVATSLLCLAAAGRRRA